MQALALGAEHWPLAPDDSQAGVAPPHSPSPAQARQVCVVVLHTGVIPPHCALDVHETQRPAPVLQTGVVPEHCAALVPEHWPQAPHDSQAGVEPPHSVSPEQARQVCVAVLQTGVLPPHWVLVRHGTQVDVAVSQTGVAPVQAVAFVAEHWPQAPVDSQAGVEPPHSLSLAQDRHVWAVVLHTGAVPLHCAVEVHGTQVPVVVKQAGVEPEQSD